MSECNKNWKNFFKLMKCVIILKLALSTIEIWASEKLMSNIIPTFDKRKILVNRRVCLLNVHKIYNS